MFQIDKYSRTPIYEQVIREVERLVATGILETESLLPSVRNLSQELGINPNTIQKAYAELERRGICHSVPGSGRYISLHARDTVMEGKKENLDTMARLTEELIDSGISLHEILQCIEQAAKKANEGRAAKTQE